METQVETLVGKYLQVKEASLDILNELPDALIIVDEQGVIQFVNREAEFLFEWPRGGTNGLLGKTLEETLIPLDKREAHSGHRKSFNKRPSPRPMRGVEGMKKTGEKIIIEVAINSVQTETGKLSFAVIRQKDESPNID